MKKKELGNIGFGKEYWDVNYAEPLEMDNIGNSLEHAKYIQSVFNLEQVKINSVIDFGFGLGHLFEDVVKTFKPIRALGIEPSEHAYSLVQKRLAKPDFVKKFHLKNIDMVTWAQELTVSEKVFDLGICTSVFQYLSDEEIEYLLPILAKEVKYLYFSAPTDIEYKRQETEYGFVDQYAIHRKRGKYLKWLEPYFTLVSSRVLESKHYFDDDNTNFKEQLFRF